MAVLLPQGGAGKELREHIERVLNLPPNLIGFELRFHIGEALTCKCEFYPVPRLPTPAQLEGSGFLPSDYEATK
jgi:hypothetical protein